MAASIRVVKNGWQIIFKSALSVTGKNLTHVPSDDGGRVSRVAKIYVYASLVTQHWEKGKANVVKFKV